MKSAPKVLHWLDFGIFPGYCLFSCGFSQSELISELKKKKADDWLLGLSNDKVIPKKCGLRRDIENKKTGESKTMHYIIHQPRFTFSDYDFTVLAHEIVHICQFYLPDVLDRNLEIEAEAYLHTHLMTQCLKALR